MQYLDVYQIEVEDDSDSAEQAGTSFGPAMQCATKESIGASKLQRIPEPEKAVLGARRDEMVSQDPGGNWKEGRKISQGQPRAPYEGCGRNARRRRQIRAAKQQSREESERDTRAVNPAKKGLQHLKPAARVDPHVEGDLGSTGGMLDAATQTPSLPPSANHVLLSFPGGMLRPSNVRSHGRKGEKEGKQKYVGGEKERTGKETEATP